MESLDVSDFPFDFVKQIYNFAAASEDFLDLALPPVSVRPCSTATLSDLFAGIDSPVSACAAEPRVDSPVSVCAPEPPRLPQAVAPASLALPASLPLPDISPEELAMALTPDAPVRPRAPTPPLQRLSPTLQPVPVPIAPLCPRPAPPASAAHVAEHAAARAAEEKRIRDYNRKLRNRESAARSNLARKRRREAQRAAEESKRRHAAA